MLSWKGFHESVIVFLSRTISAFSAHPAKAFRDTEERNRASTSAHRRDRLLRCVNFLVIIGSTSDEGQVSCR